MTASSTDHLFALRSSPLGPRLLAERSDDASPVALPAHRRSYPPPPHRAMAPGTS